MELQSPFEGRLVRLRALEPEDEPNLYEWYNDYEVTQHLMLRYPLSHATERQFIERQAQPAQAGTHFAICLKEDGRLIGGSGLTVALPENREARLGIAIGDKSYWDRGYGTDAMRTICRFGFEQMNMHRIELDVYSHNERARKVYEKVGFQVEGCRRQAVFKYGRYLDVIVMGVLEGELKLE
jgi:RimJ/RimL family protein N-acetyltransferase